MNRRLICGLAGVVALCAAAQVQAQLTSIAVPNFSFESPAQGAGGNNIAVITNWNITGSNGVNGAGVFFPNGNGGLNNPLPAPAQGSQYAFLEAPSAGNFTSLTTAGPLTNFAADTIYTLTVAVGHRNSASRLPDDYQIELLANGSVVAAASLADAFVNIPASTFTDLSLVFSTQLNPGPIGQALTVRLTHSSSAGAPDFRQGAFDNVRLTAFTLPEPTAIILWSTMGLVAVSAGGLWRRARQR